MQRKATVFYPGGQSRYDFAFPYLSKQFVRVRYERATNTQQLVYDRDYKIVDHHVNLYIACPTDVTVCIYRQTPTEQLVDFNDGSLLLASEMDKMSVQLLHLAEESSDILLDRGMITDEDNAWQGLGRRIKNLHDPVQPQDAVTLNHLDKVGVARQEELERIEHAVRSDRDTVTDAKNSVIHERETVELTVRDAKSWISHSKDAIEQTIHQGVTDMQERRTDVSRMHEEVRTLHAETKDSAAKAQNAAAKAETAAENAAENAADAERHGRGAADSANLAALHHYGAKSHEGVAQTCVRDAKQSVQDAAEKATASAASAEEAKTAAASAKSSLIDLKNNANRIEVIQNSLGTRMDGLEQDLTAAQEHLMAAKEANNAAQRIKEEVKNSAAEIPFYVEQAQQSQQHAQQSAEDAAKSAKKAQDAAAFKGVVKPENIATGTITYAHLSVEVQTQLLRLAGRYTPNPTSVIDYSRSDPMPSEGFRRAVLNRQEIARTRFNSFVVKLAMSLDTYSYFHIPGWELYADTELEKPANLLIPIGGRDALLITRHRLLDYNKEWAIEVLTSEPYPRILTFYGTLL